MGRVGRHVASFVIAKNQMKEIRLVLVLDQLEKAEFDYVTNINHRNKIRCQESRGLTDYLRMNSDIEAHKLPELLVCETKLVGVVGAVVEIGIAVWDGSVVTVLVRKDDRGYSRDFGAEVEAVFKGRLPVLGLVDAALVGLHEVALRLACEHTHGELSHSVHVPRERLDHSLFISGKFTSDEELLFEVSDLRLAWHFTCE